MTWQAVDKFCQWADYPFMIDKWTKLAGELEERALDAYIKAYTSSEYETVDWSIIRKEWADAFVYWRLPRKKFQKFLNNFMENCATLGVRIILKMI